MAQSLSNVIIHIIFSTKKRNPIISKSIEHGLFKVIGGQIKSMRANPIQINANTDHIHILTTLPRTTSISDLVKKIKTVSSKWIKNQDPDFRDFAWQHGYGVFSVSFRDSTEVIQYILNQKEHHKNQNFKNEFRQLLREYDVKFDENYLWD